MTNGFFFWEALLLPPRAGGGCVAPLEKEGPIPLGGIPRNAIFFLKKTLSIYIVLLTLSLSLSSPFKEFLGWLKCEEITASGEYTLGAATTSTDCYRVTLMDWSSSGTYSMSADALDDEHIPCTKRLISFCFLLCHAM
jgi:hypothetical protein